jgi:hypothetical protein
MKIARSNRSVRQAPATTPVKEAPVKRLDVVFAEHGMDPGDEFVGPEGSRFVLDYDGEPVVLADSRLEQDRSAHEKALWEQLQGLIKTS